MHAPKCAMEGVGGGDEHTTLLNRLEPQNHRLFHFFYRRSVNETYPTHSELFWRGLDFRGCYRGDERGGVEQKARKGGVDSFQSSTKGVALMCLHILGSLSLPPLI